MADFPDVPDAPGVPQLPRDPTAPPDEPPPFLTQDSVSSFGDPASPRWGLFQGTEAIVTAESVVSFEYRQEWLLSDYQVEDGGFETYNKVATPFDVRFRFATGGSVQDRQALLDSIAAIAGTTDVYDAVSPEATYPNVNVARYSYERSSQNGVGLLKVDVYLLQIRNTAVQTFTQTKQPSGADAVNDGTVQTIDPTADQSGFGASVQ